ncbi:MAG TPA: hypothetical protein VMB34_03100, partial [Acetobacteraceae bacterium]|nr:hypothetical protein [Acetobacteraceae bacterium]
LHWGADELGSRERLTRALGRERLKDTSLDYGLAAGTREQPEIRRESAADSVRAYAERRGLVPESEIVLRQRPAAVQHAEPARSRRGMFAGLKLDAGRAEPAPAPAVAPATTEQEREADRLVQSVGAYARAWADTARMRQAGLPVLPHQAAALADADRALDAQLPRFGEDLDAALTQAPRLAQGAGTDYGLAVLIEAGHTARGAREKLETRARETVRAWDKLEQAYDQADAQYDYRTQRAIGAEMERFAQALKRDPQLDSLLRQRGPELGIAKGSRLTLVVQSEKLDRALTRELGLSHGQGLGMGM